MSGPIASSTTGSGPYWTYVTTEGDVHTRDDTHVLYKPLEEICDDLADDLLEIRMKIKYSTTIQPSEEIQLRDKITERLRDYFYDCDPVDVDKLITLIEFKEWPSDFGIPATLSINGKSEGPTLLILLRPKKPVMSEEGRHLVRKRCKKIKAHQDSKHSIKGLSHIHSMKARRK